MSVYYFVSLYEFKTGFTKITVCPQKKCYYVSTSFVKIRKVKALLYLVT